jgi:hypothetical protein
LVLSAWDEIGEPPHSPLARDSSTESGRPAASGRGRRCQGASHEGGGPDLGHRQRRGSPWWLAAKQVDGGEPATVGQRRGGGCQLGGRGAAVSSGGGRCGGGGARRWPEVAPDRKAASANEEGGGRRRSLEDKAPLERR